MKELIEKIKELQDAFKFHCCQVTCEQILGMIEDQESKPFNPELLGIQELGIIDIDYFVYQSENKTTDFCLIRPKGNKTDWDISAWYKKDKVPRDAIFSIKIKIPNHRQGVELLRNLGVIE